MRIMPLGDNNTYDAGNTGVTIPYAAGECIGYRLRLKSLLSAAGVPVQFVGSVSTGYAAGLSDSANEGWSGGGVVQV